MTKEKLMEVYYIQKEINSWQEELEKMEEEEKHSAKKSEQRARLEQKIKRKVAELERIKNEVTSYILDIDDCQTRLIFKLRCLNLLSWNAVADRVGGMNSEDSVKKRFYRYLEKCG